jgi:hypothetical protein
MLFSTEKRRKKKNEGIATRANFDCWQKHYRSENQHHCYCYQVVGASAFPREKSTLQTCSLSGVIWQPFGEKK